MAKDERGHGSDSRGGKKKDKVAARIHAGAAKARSSAKHAGYKRVSTRFGRGYFKEGEMTFKPLNKLHRTRTNKNTMY